MQINVNNFFLIFLLSFNYATHNSPSNDINMYQLIYILAEINFNLPLLKFIFSKILCIVLKMVFPSASLSFARKSKINSLRAPEALDKLTANPSPSYNSKQTFTKSPFVCKKRTNGQLHLAT